MTEPVRARRLTDQEGQRLQQIVRRGKHGSIRVRRQSDRVAVRSLAHLCHGRSDHPNHAVPARKLQDYLR